MITANSTGLFPRRFRKGIRPDPTRDWFVLLTLAVIAFTAIVVWNIWAFDTVASGGTIGAPATSTPRLFDRSTIDTVHAVFEKRAEEEAKYTTGVYRSADPSQ